MMTTLNNTSPGDRCQVLTIHGSDSISQRLMEMGLIEGTTVDVIRFAPLGDPMEIILHGYHLSLRKSEAARVEVEPCK